MLAAALNDNAPGADIGGWGLGNGSHDGDSEEIDCKFVLSSEANGLLGRKEDQISLSARVGGRFI